MFQPFFQNIQMVFEQTYDLFTLKNKNEFELKNSFNLKILKFKVYNGGTNNHNLPYKMTYGKEAWYVNVQKQNDLWMKRSRTRKFDNAIEYRLTWKISPDVHDQQEICFYVNSAKW